MKLPIAFTYDDIWKGTRLTVDNGLMLGLVRETDDRIRYGLSNPRSGFEFLADRKEIPALVDLGYVVLEGDGFPRLTKQGKKISDLVNARHKVWWTLNRHRLEPKDDYKPPPKTPYPEGKSKSSDPLRTPEGAAGTVKSE